MVLQSHIMHKIDKTNKNKTNQHSHLEGEKTPNEKEPKFTSFSFFYSPIKYSIIIQCLSIFSLDSKAKGSEKRQFSSSCHLPWRRGMDTTLSPYKQITDSG